MAHPLCLLHRFVARGDFRSADNDTLRKGDESRLKESRVSSTPDKLRELMQPLRPSRSNAYNTWTGGVVASVRRRDVPPEWREAVSGPLVRMALGMIGV